MEGLILGLHLEKVRFGHMEVEDQEKQHSKQSQRNGTAPSLYRT